MKHYVYLLFSNHTVAEFKIDRPKKPILYIEIYIAKPTSCFQEFAYKIIVAN